MAGFMLKFTLSELRRASSTSRQTREVDEDNPFLMWATTVVREGSFSIVSGRVKRGSLRSGDTVELVGIVETRKAVVRRVEERNHVVDAISAGDYARVLLENVGDAEVSIGQVLATPGSMKPSRQFGAEVYLRIPQEGGRHTPIFQKHAVIFSFETVDVPGRLILPEHVAMLTPGESGIVTVLLSAPIALESKLEFRIREHERAIGIGIVTELFDLDDGRLERDEPIRVEASSPTLNDFLATLEQPSSSVSPYDLHGHSMTRDIFKLEPGFRSDETKL